MVKRTKTDKVDSIMRIGIIGGGAAGMMCAATLLKEHSGEDIFLIDRNDGLGKKVIISGGGRCNVTTGIHEIKTLLKKYPRGEKFLTSAMYAFPPNAVYDWFESHGVPLKIQEDGRVFPRSDDGKDVVRVFEKLFKTYGLHVLLNTSVVGVEKKDDAFLIHFKHTPTPLVVDILVMTTGGQTYRQTGSTGDGYAFATSLGHTITELAPSLNAFFTKEHWPAHLSGLSWTQATLTAKRAKHPKFTGPFLFTHKGISGPAVFALSSLVAFETYNIQHPLEIMIDLFPALSIQTLHIKLEFLIEKNPQKQFGNILGLVVPKSLAEVTLQELQIDETKRADELGKKNLNRLCNWIKAIPLSVIQRGTGDEFVTAGGINLREVNPRTMESKICPGLYFAGEILDIDGFTGGFNLQASWATGHLVGSRIKK
ncbi:MAG: NAD(FAD)-utilizing dehydrogenase [Candidatus Uhrbacteria bacterium GW2011_GWF2_39_13]|uniref:NAD(FAD)-utilizing dehydrogenase n=1 Tax=Candidatus Uhrbacteria bacterium GW2011_GWF2_39_13 TaxID=1618995 RepID=A0A0G0MLL4_9BACT|nr:MAG: NAD(FAD)-utilizing dehydrogenase [Candidatus Uhrbacteria bacterium GW2011_GWF2_39_13]